MFTHQQVRHYVELMHPLVKTAVKEVLRDTRGMRKEQAVPWAITSRLITRDVIRKGIKLHKELFGGEPSKSTIKGVLIYSRTNWPVMGIDNSNILEMFCLLSKQNINNIYLPFYSVGWY